MVPCLQSVGSTAIQPDGVWLDITDGSKESVVYPSLNVMKAHLKSMSTPVTTPEMRPVAIDVLTSIYGVQSSVSGPNVKATSRKYW